MKLSPGINLKEGDHCKKMGGAYYETSGPPLPTTTFEWNILN